MKNKCTVEAVTENLNRVLEFVEEQLPEECSNKIKVQIQIAVEEIFVNIAHYAYASGAGMADISVEVSEPPSQISITFEDEGVPYNPLEKEDPNITLAAAKRPIGGLGIYMVKQSMDQVGYAYENGKNKLTLVKKLSV